MTLDELIQDEKYESFEEGRSEGIEIGLARGRSEGIELGRSEGLAEGMEKGLEKALAVMGVSEEEYQQILRAKAEQ